MDRLLGSLLLAALFGVFTPGCRTPGVRTAVYAPIVHEPFWVQEPELFGHRPEFMPDVISFDAANRPYIRHENEILTVDRNGSWHRLDFTAAIKAAYPAWDGTFQKGDFTESHLVFDDGDTAWMVVNLCRSNINQMLLLYSRDHCRTWTVTPVCDGDRRTFSVLEHRDTHNQISGPPVLLIGRPSPAGTMGIVLVAPAWQADGTLAIGDLMPVTDDGYLIPIHSGGGNMAVSRNGRTHIFWAADTPVPGRERDGTPTYARTFDHTTRTFGATVFLGLGGKGKPDNHNLPAVTFDSHGYLHLLLGAHHDPFLYRRSREPDTVAGGWTDPAPVGTPRTGSGGGSYTYVGLVCDARDTLHSVARWAGDGYIFRLAYLRKPASEPWQPHQILVSPFKGMYSCWYHKQVIDRRGRLLFNYVMFTAQLSHEHIASLSQKFPDEPNFWFFGPAGKRGRSILLSDDGGDRWRLAETADFTGLDTPEPAKPTPPLPPLPPRPLETLAQFGGSVNAVVSAGDELICAIGTRLVALRLGEDGLRVTRQSAVVPDELRAVLVHDRQVYAASARRLYVFALESAPTWEPIATLAVPSAVERLAMVGGTLYVLSGPGGVTLVDVSSPAAPVKVRALAKPRVHDLAVRGSLAYLACGDDGLRVWDVTASAAPAEVAKIPYEEGQRATSIFAVTVANDRLFVGPGPNGIVLRVFDLKDPLRPSEVGRLEEPAWSWGRKVLVDGNLAYYPGPDRLAVLDVADPAKMRKLGEFPASGNLKDMLAVGTRLFAPTGANGLMVFDCRQPATPVLPTTYTEPVCPWGITVTPGGGLLADWYGGLFTLNAGPTLGAAGLLPKPQVGLNELIPSRFRAVSVGTTAFVAAGPHGLLAVDISDRAHPVAAGSWTFAGGIRHVAGTGNLLYLAEAGHGLRVLDVSRPGTPDTRARLPADREILSVGTAGDLVVTASMLWNGRAEVVVYKGGQTGRLRRISQFETDHDTYGLALTAAGWLYLAQADHGIEVVDLREPSQPRPHERLQLAARAWDVAVAEQGLLVAAGQAGLLLVNP